MIALLNHLGDLCARLAHGLLPLAWQGSLLILAVWLVTRLWRRGPACVKYALWLLALLKLLLPVPFALPVAAVNLVPAAPPLPRQATAVQAVEVHVVPPTVTIRHHALKPWSPAAMLGATWLTGALGFLLTAFMRHRRIRRLLERSGEMPAPELAALAGELRARLGLRHAPRLLISDSVDSPLVIGPWRPLVIVPGPLFESMPPAESRLLLAHELAHLKRLDHPAALLDLLALAAHFYNPLVWLAVRELRAERERACDDRVVTLPDQPGADDTAAIYSSGLLKAVRRQQAPAWPAMPGALFLHERKSEMALRIRRLLDPSGRLVARLSWPALLGLILLACIVLPSKGQTVARDHQTSGPAMIANGNNTSAGAARDTAKPVVTTTTLSIQTTTSPTSPTTISHRISLSPANRPSTATVRTKTKDKATTRASVTTAMKGALFPHLAYDKLLADKVHYNESSKTMTLSGDAVLSGPQIELRCDELKINPVAHTLCATGNVLITKLSQMPAFEVVGDENQKDHSQNKLDHITSQRLTYNDNTRRWTLEGNPQIECRNAKYGKRTRFSAPTIIIFPTESGETGLSFQPEGTNTGQGRIEMIYDKQPPKTNIKPPKE